MRISPNCTWDEPTGTLILNLRLTINQGLLAPGRHPSEADKHYLALTTQIFHTALKFPLPKRSAIFRLIAAILEADMREAEQAGDEETANALKVDFIRIQTNCSLNQLSEGLVLPHDTSRIRILPTAGVLDTLLTLKETLSFAPPSENDEQLMVMTATFLFGTLKLAPSLRPGVFRLAADEAEQQRGTFPAAGGGDGETNANLLALICSKHNLTGRPTKELPTGDERTAGDFRSKFMRIRTDCSWRGFPEDRVLRTSLKPHTSSTPPLPTGTLILDLYLTVEKAPEAATDPAPPSEAETHYMALTTHFLYAAMKLPLPKRPAIYRGIADMIEAEQAGNEKTAKALTENFIRIETNCSWNKLTENLGPWTSLPPHTSRTRTLPTAGVLDTLLTLKEAIETLTPPSEKDTRHMNAAIKYVYFTMRRHLGDRPLQFRMGADDIETKIRTGDV